LKANIVFQEELDKRTNCDDDTDAKIQTYVEANKKVALLLNHGNVASKVDKKLIEKLYSDIKSKAEEVDKAKEKSENGNDEGGVRRTVVQRLTAQPDVLERQLSERLSSDDENLCLETSKLNYLDPRITIAWCKKNDVELEKVFSNKLRDNFRWSLDTEEQFRF
jgi:DNA topoisomerase-1